MGMFDSLFFDCPKCGTRLEAQTKSGPCVFEQYTFEDENLPNWLKLDLDKTVDRCYNCNVKYCLDFDVHIVSLKKEVRLLSAIEEFEWHKKPLDGNDTF